MSTKDICAMLSILALSIGLIFSALSSSLQDSKIEKLEQRIQVLEQSLSTGKKS